MSSSPSLPASLPPAARLCLACCHRDPEAPRDGSHRRLSGDNGFRETMGYAVRHGVAGLTLQTLDRLGPAWGLDEEVLEPVAGALSLARRQATFREMEQTRVLAGLDAVDLDPVVLKGGALRHTAYASPVERTMGDLDLLVERDHVDAVLSRLAELGYRSPYPEGAAEGFREHHYHERVESPAGFEIEVHWALTRPGHPMPLDTAAVLSRAVRLPGDVRVPSPEDNLLHTVSQAEQGAVRKLSRVVDLDRILTAQPIDWEYVETAASRAGLEGFLAVTIRLANLTLGTPAPAHLLRGAPFGRVARRGVEAFDPVVHLVEEPRRGRHSVDHLFRVWCQARPDLRWRLIRDAQASAEDPLDWIWEIHVARKEGIDPEEAARKPVARSVLFLKLALVQCLMSPKMVTRRGRFWSSP